MLFITTTVQSTITIENVKEKCSFLHFPQCIKCIWCHFFSFKICKFDLCYVGCTVNQYEPMTKNTILMSFIVKENIFCDVTSELAESFGRMYSASLTLKMENVYYCKTSTSFYQTTNYHSQENSTLHSHPRENLTFHKFYCSLLN
jgi:hypothetical protein